MLWLRTRYVSQCICETLPLSLKILSMPAVSCWSPNISEGTRHYVTLLALCDVYRIEELMQRVGSVLTCIIYTTLFSSLLLNMIVWPQGRSWRLIWPGTKVQLGHLLFMAMDCPYLSAALLPMFPLRLCWYWAGQLGTWVLFPLSRAIQHPININCTVPL